MNAIKTFEDACKAVNIDPEKVLPETSAYPFPHQKALVAIAKLFIIADVLNKGWKPNWNNEDEYKYYPWFNLETDKNNPSGFRLLLRDLLLHVFVCRLPPLLQKPGNCRVRRYAVHRSVS
jgi:hypothetical protein